MQNQHFSSPFVPQKARHGGYYETELMQLIVKEFVRNNKRKIFEEVEYLILSVGTSYEPLVLSISLFCPKKILFITKAVKYRMDFT